MFCFKCGEKIPEDAVFCTKCGNKVKNTEETTQVAPVVPQAVAVSKHNAADIKEYLGHAKSLEVTLYTLAEAKTRLQRIINVLGKKAYIEAPESEAINGFSSFWSVFFKCLLVCVVICIFVCGDAWDSVLANILSIVTVVLLFMNAELLIGVGVSIGISLAFALAFCLIRVAVKNAEYKQAYKEYQCKVDEDDKRVRLEKEQILALQKQQRTINDEMRKTRATLDRLYSIDVIKPKYRELIPIVTMYEYFDYERCYDLVGPNGAYNLYENESRQNIIISNLNQVISMLSRIEHNQHALYEAIRESNYYAEKMYSQANAMLKTHKAIEHNSAIAAYNAKIAAENSTISAYIDICNL